MTDYRAEITTGISFRRGAIACLTLYDVSNVKIGSKARGRKVGTLVEDSMPKLLRAVADFYEQEDGWEGIAAQMDAASEKNEATAQ